MIHRAFMPKTMPERLTLTGGLVRHRLDDPLEEPEDQFAWRLAENIRPSLPEKTRRFYDNWRSLLKV